ncbi:MAG: FAD-dependent thymidylate synthase [Candidatus Margulisiibacteriota bacterium]
MKILLAGYNVDAEVLEELKKNSPQRQDVTPETLSAAYARISRDPRPIDELRKAAREEVEKTRKSNSTIIFKMGHHSVAEHAVFNFDLIGISRLAVEFIEHFRLCSFTEKSQRYITLGDDHVIPEEIRGSEIQSKYIEILREQNGLYHRLNEKLRKYVFEKHKGLAADPKNRNLLEGWAKEDARYITSLATEAQLGLTMNARNLELFLRRAKSQKLAEIKELAEQMYALVEKIAPSIILFTEANDYDAKTYDDIKTRISNFQFPISNVQSQTSNDVTLVEHTKDADDVLAASLLYAVSKEPYDSCMVAMKKMSAEEKKELVKASCRHMELYDTTLREYENVNFTFDVILSSSCFAQLKRHRMSTIIAKDYDTELGVTIPPSIKETGMEKAFMEVAEKTEKVYRQMQKESPLAAPYVLTNAHRRRVLFSCNARELYHVSRLREDAHAQWDIQNLSRLMSQEAKKTAPLTCLFLGGKDAYSEIRRMNFAS